MIDKDLIQKYSNLKYEKSNRCGIDFINFDTTDYSDIDIDYSIFNSDTLTEVNFENDFFSHMEVIRFDDMLLIEFIKLGEEDGYYKDWSYIKFMEELKKTCDSYDGVYVNNYDLSVNDPYGRAFFFSMLLNINEYENFIKMYNFCAYTCNMLVQIAEERLRNIWWNEAYEKDEILFCKMFLAGYFTNLGFDKVIFNHGNKEFGKDFILETRNLFGNKEYYGVQAKAGNLKGNATGDILEIINQSKLAFSVPYKDVDGSEVYISKFVIAISGNFTDNAKEIICRNMDKNIISNIIFLSKPQLSMLNLSNI